MTAIPDTSQVLIDLATACHAAGCYPGRDLMAVAIGLSTDVVHKRIRALQNAGRWPEAPPGLIRFHRRRSYLDRFRAFLGGPNPDPAGWEGPDAERALVAVLLAAHRAMAGRPGAPARPRRVTNPAGGRGHAGLTGATEAERRQIREAALAIREANERELAAGGRTSRVGHEVATRVSHEERVPKVHYVARADMRALRTGGRS